MSRGRHIPPVRNNVVELDPSGDRLPAGFEAWADRCDALWSAIQRLSAGDPAPKCTAMVLAGYVALFLVENRLDVATFCDDVKAEAYSHPGVRD